MKTVGITHRADVLGVIVFGSALLAFPTGSIAQGAGQEHAGQALEPHALLATLVSNEQAANPVRGYYRYQSEERSDRTGGHLWTERVAETREGTVRFLVMEDGKPISAEREAQIRSGLAWDLAHPALFASRSAQDRAEDEKHTETMLRLLPVAFVFDPLMVTADSITLHYRPNPAYQPQSMEERVMHAMEGQVVVNRAAVRLQELDGRADQDVDLGLGPLATIKGGSNFRSVRVHEQGPDWKLQTLHSAFAAQALMIKDLGRNQDVRHWDFVRLPDTTTLPDAVRMIEQP